MNDLSRTFDEVVSIIETARSNAFRKVKKVRKTAKISDKGLDMSKGTMVCCLMK